MSLGWRDYALRVLVAWGAALALITEILGTFHQLKRWPVLLAWLLAAGLMCWRLRPPKIRLVWSWFEGSILAAIIGIAIIGVTALASPPNSGDALAYHMPRVVYWAQEASVDFFPTPYLNQIMLSPLAEYAMLHTYLLSGADRFVNLIQWIGFIGSVIGVSLISGALGLASRGQAIAALFAATLPNGILQASGAKNDFFLALWLTATVYFALRWSMIFFGLALALALGTKATAFLFAPAMIVFAIWRSQLPVGRATLAAALCIFAINGPQYWRNIRLSGSPIGYDSAHGDGFFRWRNESFSLGGTVSNLIRNTSEQLGSRSNAANQRVYRAVLEVHRWLSLDPQDPNTTFRWGQYRPPKNANHEADANNRWHLLIFLVAFVASIRVARRDPQWLLYGLAVLAGFLAFSFYLKWQEFMGRLILPLFVLGAPLVAWGVGLLRFTIPQGLVCLFLLSVARLPLTENWTRPLEGPKSILRVSREDVLFYDTAQWSNTDSYREAVRLTVESGCSEIGIDASENQLEYPYQALVRERIPGARFTHTGVTNVSTRYERREFEPCLILCLDCAGNEAKVKLYADFGPPQRIGKFLLFRRTR